MAADTNPKAVEAGSTQRKLSFFESTAHLVKGCLGGGILGIHEAYMKCGLWTALALTMFFTVYLVYCEHMLVRSAQILYTRLNLPQMSYPDVAQKSLEAGPFPNLRKYNKIFRYAVDVTICTNLFGACCVYEIMIAKTIQQVVESQGGGHISLRLYLVALLVPILLLGMIRSLKYLAPFSIIANCFIVACVVSTIVYSQRVAPPISTVPGWKNIIGLLEFCGVAVFSIECVGVILPIENNMKIPLHFPRVLVTGLSIVVSFVIMVGFFGYWGFGEDCQSPVILNFPQELFPIILRCLIAFVIYITYALNFWAPFNLVWYYLKKKFKPEKYWIWERVFRAIIITIITIVAIGFPNIGNLMGLLGALAVSNMAFIYPAIINTLVLWESPGMGKHKWRLWKNTCILILGFLLLCAGTCANVKGLIESIYIESTGHLIKGSLGAGILGIHEAYMKCGLWTSLGLMFFFAFYLIYCEYMLVYSAQILYTRLNLPPLTYPDVAEKTIESAPFLKVRKYRKFCRYLVDATAWGGLFGSCCVYHIIMAKTLKQVMETEGYGEVSVRLYILALLMPVLLLCMMNTMKVLAPFSMAADFFLVLCVIATVVYSLQVAPPISTVPGWKSTMGLFEYCGIAIFTIEGGVLFPIENNMKKPLKFPLVLCTGMTIVVFFVMTIGFFGYWGYGENCQTPVTMNFPSETFPMVLKCLVAVMLYFTYALNFQAAFNLVWFYAKKKYEPNQYWIWERVERAFAVLIITLIAITFPNIGNLMGLFGAVVVSNMGFIFPAIINTIVLWEAPGMGRYKWRLWKNTLIGTLGLVLLCAGTFANLKGLIGSM